MPRSETGHRGTWRIGYHPSGRFVVSFCADGYLRVDGAGYPDGLTEEEIPVCSSNITVVDAYDAMTSNRSNQQAVSAQDAVTELQRELGTQFDPAIVEAFAAVLAESPQGRAVDQAAHTVPGQLLQETRHSTIEVLR